VLVAEATALEAAEIRSEADLETEAAPLSAEDLAEATSDEAADAAEVKEAEAALAPLWVSFDPLLFMSMEGRRLTRRGQKYRKQWRKKLRIQPQKGSRKQRRSRLKLPQRRTKRQTWLVSFGHCLKQKAGSLRYSRSSGRSSRSDGGSSASNSRRGGGSGITLRVGRGGGLGILGAGSGGSSSGSGGVTDGSVGDRDGGLSTDSFGGRHCSVDFVGLYSQYTRPYLGLRGTATNRACTSQTSEVRS